MKYKLLSTVAGISAAASLAVALLVDQFLTQYVPIIRPYFGLQRSYNTGVAFGFHLGQFQDFIVIGAIAVVVFVALRTKRTQWEDVGFGLMLGGGIANVLDRLMDGRVTDMIQVGRFPIFNIADVCINIGVAILLLQLVVHWFQKRR